MDAGARSRTTIRVAAEGRACRSSRTSCTSCRTLRERLLERHVTSARVREPVVLRFTVRGNLSLLLGRKLEDAFRKSHFLVFRFEGLDLAVNPMLAGRFRLVEPGAPDEASLGFALGFGDVELRYLDDKKMGKAYLITTDDWKAIPGLQTGGIDLLSLEFSRERFVSLLKHRRDQVRVFLLDKKALDSLGNAYADEVLFEAGIHPKTFCRSLTHDDGVRLHDMAALRDGAEILFTDAVRERFDIVAFDARGNPVDILEPNVHCTIDGELPDIVGDPRTLAAADLLEQVDARDRRLADACAAGSGEILPLIGTANVVQDIDRLREALGEDQLSFVGISYGTVTGQRYAERYPGRVRAMILDAPVDLAADVGSAARASATTGQRLFDGFLAACATDPTCAVHSDGRPRQAFEALVARLAAAPLDGISAADLWTVVVLGLRQPDQLDEQLAAIAASDMASTVALLEMLDDPDGLGYATAMNCIDRDFPRTAAAIADDIAALRADAPDFAWQAIGEAACLSWPVAAERPAAPARASGAPPILVIGSTDDPSTPYAWAGAVAGALDSGVLLTRVGTNHGSIYLDNPCIDRLTDAYLLNLEAPASGTRCQ